MNKTVSIFVLLIVNNMKNVRGFLICILLIYAVVPLCAQTAILKEARENFKKAVQDEALCKKYYELLKDNVKTECEKGYAAAYQMFMAKHTSNPIKKMSFFNGGKKLLESQAQSNPNNIELRFIRLMIQYHAPSFLGYKDNIRDDKEFMLNNLYKFDDSEAKKLLYQYLKGTNMYSEQELLLLGR